MRNRVQAWLPAVFVLLFAIKVVAGEALFPFVIPWDDDSASVTNISSWLEKPAGAHGFITARDGHLFAGNEKDAKRIRFFGVNFCFGANFPSHDEAEKIAAHLAKFGIGCVRLHHMDTQDASNGILQKDKGTLDPERLERLDYFIAQLKTRGIYVDINLHVGRNYPDCPPWPQMPGACKGVDNFFPRMIALQKDYARDLLTHKNPYTGNAYTDETSVAFIEINNENSLLREWWDGRLDEMPEAYAGELRNQWNAWLTKKYESNEKLASAWNQGAEPLGEEILGAELGSKILQAPWKLELHGTAKATSGAISEIRRGGADRVSRPVLNVSVQEIGAAPWHVQLTRGRLKLEGGKSYTFTFSARADKPRTIQITASQAHEPWKSLWSAKADLTNDWKTFTFAFTPNESDGNARIGFTNLGAAVGEYYFQDFSLKPGGLSGLREGEKLGAADIFKKSEMASRTLAAQQDWIRFLYDTEENYWLGMQRFLKEDLHAKPLLIGTQMGYSPFPIQAQLDVVDVHGYWQHPHFPHRQWDMSDWTVKNESMVNAPNGGEIGKMAGMRVTGKPYICTEYNEPAPNTFSSETFPLLCAYAAMQDWDAVFAFAYSHDLRTMKSGKISSFFDIAQHPTKMATLPASVAMFVRGDVAVSGTSALVKVSSDQVLEQIRTGGPAVNAYQFGLFGTASNEALRRRTVLEIGQGHGLQARAFGSLPDKPGIASISGGRLNWDAGNQNDRIARVTINTPKSVGVIGFTQGPPFVLGDVRIDTPSDSASEGSRRWATINATVLEGDDFKTAKRILITATGYAENTDMGWKNAEKNTVGKDWGKAPSLVEGIRATITLSVAEGIVGQALRLPSGTDAAAVRQPERLPYKAWALDERGQRKTEVPVKISDDGKSAVLEIGPEWKTLWYEIEKQ